jgi:hypothetical protein
MDAMKKLIVVIGAAAALIAVVRGPDTASSQSTNIKVLGVACAVVGGTTAFYLEIDTPPYGWRQMPYPGRDLPPVPVSSLASYESGIAITDAGEGWLRTSSGWVSLGLLPSGSQPAQRATWGAVKSTYRH